MMRQLSLLLAAMAFIAVPIWAYLSGEADVRAQAEAQGWACGLPILGMYMFALLISGLLSAVALTLGVLAYRRLPSPKPGARPFELIVIAAPLVLATLGMLALLFLPL